MKALVNDGRGSLEMRDVAEPRAAEGETIVAVSAVGICGTDVGAIRHERPKVAAEMTLGHEFVGWRTDTGERVVVNPLVACGVCPRCAEGRGHICVARTIIGIHRHGALAPLVAVPIANLSPVGNLTRERAAMVDPLATALHAWNLAGRPARRIAIFGAGAIGLSLLHVAKHYGVRDVTIVDLSPERLLIARGLGADTTTLNVGDSFEATFDAVGATATREAALARVRAGGTAVLIGLHDAEIRLAGGLLIGAERRLQGAFGYTDSQFREAILLAESLDTTWVYSVPFHAAVTAFQELSSGRAGPSNVKLQVVVASTESEVV